jgi:hypothetical protein
VRRRTLVLTLIAGLAVFLAVLVRSLPASWFGGFLPPTVQCAELGGSVWNGECLGLVAAGQKLGDATWNISLGRVFTGRLAGDVSISGTPIMARADFDTSFGGDGEIRNLTAQFPIDPAVLVKSDRDKRGHVALDLKRLAFVGGQELRAIEGTVEVRDFRQVIPQLLDLGSYRATFPGEVGADGAIKAALVDTGGPYRLVGELTLHPARSAYEVAGRIAGRTPQSENNVRNITFGAQPDAEGLRTFGIDGTW